MVEEPAIHTPNALIPPWITGHTTAKTAEMITDHRITTIDPNAVTHTLFGKEILVNGYFTSVLGAPALNMGVFVGIISGFVGGTVYNKYYNYRKLPDALAFFNGKRFVPTNTTIFNAGAPKTDVK